MAIGSILVQPQKIERASTADADSALAQDFMRLLATLAADVQQDGQILLAIVAAFEATASRMVLRVASTFTVAQQELRRWIEPAIAQAQQLSATASAPGSPAAGFALAEELLNKLVQLLNALTLDQLRVQIGTFLDILHNDLGMTSSFIEEQIWALIDDLIVRLEQIGSDSAVQANVSGVTCMLRRIRRRFQGEFEFPVLEPEPLARALLAQVRALHLDTLLSQAGCALMGVAEAVNTGATLTELVPFGINSVAGPNNLPGVLRHEMALRRAAVAAPQAVDKYQYAWYATWLLQYKYRDVPLLGISDLKNAKSLANKLKNPSDPITRFLRSQLKAGEQAIFDAYDGTSKPSDALIITLLDLLNRLLRGEGDALSTTLFHSERFPRVEFSEDTREMSESYAEDKELILFNRMVLEDALPEELEQLPRTFFGKRGADIVELVKDAVLEWPGDRVAVDKEGKRVLLGDKILFTGENVTWHEAPIFELSGLPHGQRYYIFPHITPGFLDDCAFATSLIADGIRTVWHLALIKENRQIGPVLNSAYDLVHGITSLATRTPISGFDFSGHKFWGWAMGMSALMTTLGSVQTTDRDWFSAVREDISALLEPNGKTDLGRNAILSFMTLYNMGGPRDGPSTLPNNPAENNQEIDGIVALAIEGFSAWLKTLMEESGNKVVLWLLGSVGVGLLAGFTGTVVAEIIAWAEDWKLLGMTMLKSIPKVFIAALLS